MRIVILSTFHPYRGGIAQFNACLYRELEKQGHEVIAFNFKRQYPSLLFPGKTQYVESDDSADPIPSTRVLDSINPFTWNKTAKKVLSEKPDLVIVRYWMSFLAPALGLTCSKIKKSGIPIVAIADNIIPHEPKKWDKPMARYFLKRVSGVVTMNREVEEQVRVFNPALQSIRLVHPVYDHLGEKIDKDLARRKLAIPSDKKVLLFFGLIREYKGLDILLDAFSGLDAGYHLLIAGEAYGDFSIYEEKIRNSPLNQQITVINRYIGDMEVPLFFSAADVVVLPYRSATQSGITAVAYHFEVPVIATNVGGLAEVIDHEMTGLIVSEPDILLVRESILHFFELRKRTNFNENIRNHVKKFSWSAFVEALLKFSAHIK